MTDVEQNASLPGLANAGQKLATVIDQSHVLTRRAMGDDVTGTEFGEHLAK